MRIGIGLPAAVPGFSARGLPAWAVRAEERGFATLAVLDRLAYANLEPLVALAAAAAVTERIGLAASVLIAPYRADVAVLAKQAASVERLAGGRLTLGLSAGLRRDDYDLNGVPYADRGARLDAMIGRLRELWAGDEVGPDPADGGPALMIGGNSDAALRRAARHGFGWIAGAGSADQYGRALARMRAFWSEHGHTSTQPTKALVFYALGERATELANRYLLDYYAFLGPHREVMARKAVTGEQGVRECVAGYRRAGCDELLFFPCADDPAQLDLLADALAGLS
ncbi:LLM class flavin-dependent oxidoreductase [Actinokineospora enzanensis]|uniref:LLM class flavin-dependent oxidoreductase n=1 Tax=Actinokineospora enzanensis TaxID=155975 RepID=UPI000475D9C5|nr:LLM class flavin-dependent oxidoreductase [Actinokineospora enzanensis]